MFKDAKTKAVSNLIMECDRDIKKLYQVIYNMTGKHSINSLPDSDSEEELANNFAYFFINKIKIFSDQLNKYPKFDQSVNSKPIPTMLNKFKPMLAEDITLIIKLIIKSMVSESCELDVIPTTLLKDILPHIIDTLVKIINASLEQGVFAEKWKVAIVRPLLKKLGLELTLHNYRPVSNLSFLSNVLEKCALKQCDDHCKMCAPLPDYQSAYTQLYSCKTVLVKLINDLLCNIKNSEVMAFVTIYLSVAFNTVDHRILLDVLLHHFSVAGMARKWFESYLSPRQYKINIGKEYSEPIDLEFSVPQVSCASPILFLLYAITNAEVVPPPIDIHGCADDHVVKDKFRAKCKNSKIELSTIHKLEQCLDSIKTWMDLNQLKMNSSKTEFILLGSKWQLQKCMTNSINANGADVKCSGWIQYLWALLDSQLSMTQHITSKCRTAMVNLLKIKQI